MKKSITCSLVLTFALFSLHASAAIQTVGHVDLARFAGTWYEIARNPTIFEPVCACARQVLTPAADAKIAVYNSCNQDTVTGPLREIRGTAVPSDDTGAKLVVDFGLLRKGDYWVIALESDYRYAVVTDRYAYSLYILSRTPDLSDELYQGALATAKTQVSVEHLLITDQKNCRYP